MVRIVAPADEATAAHWLLSVGASPYGDSVVSTPLPTCPMWTDPKAGMVSRWFARPGLALREDAGTWVWAIAQSEQAPSTCGRSCPATG
jgi:hypothetical protein